MLALMLFVFALVVVAALVLSTGTESNTPVTPVPTEEQAPPDGAE